MLAAAPLAYATGSSAPDFGKLVESLLNVFSIQQFGFVRPVAATSIEDLPRRPQQPVSELLDVAKGLKAEIFSREIAHNADQFAFWPTDANPTHIIACIEVFSPEVIGAFPNGTPKLTPGVQRIDLKTREVATIVRGTAGCDGIRLTPWGTILFTEEDGSFTGDGHLGNAFELLDPLAISDVTVGRGATRGQFFDSTGRTLTGDAAAAPAAAGGFGLAIRQSLVEMAWEGIAFTPEGVVIAGDELRPGTRTSATVGGPDADGGAIFKFVPDAPLVPGTRITSLAQSPVAAGRSFAMRVTCSAGNSGFGQGCQKGNAVWVQIDPLQARAEADRVGATGFYRPEDLVADPNYAGPGLRFCFTNTGDQGALNFGEVLCAVDNDPLLASTTLVADLSGSLVTASAQVDMQVFLEGDDTLNQPDNIDIQFGTGNVYVIEDNANGDIFACLPDGSDRNVTTDGCVRLLTLKDRTAEPTGFGFNARGDTAYFFVQHSADDNDPMARNNDCPNPAALPDFVRDGFCTDDMIRITGFKLPGRTRN
jgi:hypothetical protein